MVGPLLARAGEGEASTAHHDVVGRHRRNRTVAGQRRGRESTQDRSSWCCSSTCCVVVRRGLESPSVVASGSKPTAVGGSYPHSTIREVEARRPALGKLGRLARTAAPADLRAPCSMNSCHTLRGIRAAGHVDAADVAHRNSSDRSAHPHRGDELRCVPDEPRVGVVLRRAGLAGDRSIPSAARLPVPLFTTPCSICVAMRATPASTACSASESSCWKMDSPSRSSTLLHVVRRDAVLRRRRGRRTPTPSPGARSPRTRCSSTAAARASRRDPHPPSGVDHAVEPHDEPEAHERAVDRER